MSAHSRPRRRFRNADETRSRILAAALGEFAASGYRGASLAAIAARAQISQSGLLHHYASKELLLTAVIERRNDDHRAEYLHAVEDDPDLGFMTGLVRLMRRAARELDLTRLFCVVIAEATSPSHPAHEWAVARYAMVNRLVADALRGAQQRGLLRADFDPPEVACTLLAAMDGLQLRHILTPQDLRIDRAFAQLAGQMLVDLATDDAAAEKISAWRATHASG